MSPGGLEALHNLAEHVSQGFTMHFCSKLSHCHTKVDEILTLFAPPTQSFCLLGQPAGALRLCSSKARSAHSIVFSMVMVSGFRLQFLYFQK